MAGVTDGDGVGDSGGVVLGVTDGVTEAPGVDEIDGVTVAVGVTVGVGVGLLDVIICGQ